MPLFLVTSVDDEGVYEGRFRVMEAESAEAIAQDMLDNPFDWEPMLNNTELWWDLTRYERKYGEPLGWTADDLLEKIEETRVDGDSRNQVRIHEIGEIERIPIPSSEMDKLGRYREIIRETLTPLTQIHFSSPGIVNEAVFDTERDRYLIVTIGWEGSSKRIYFNYVHLDIINGKVWIQRDGTEDGIGYALEAAGIPKEDIVPAFHPENVRAHTGYAVA